MSANEVIKLKETRDMRDVEYKFESGLAIVTIDLNYNIIYANKRFCEISGYEKSELIGKNYELLRHPSTPKRYVQDIKDSMVQKKNWEGVIKNIRKDGSYYWVYTIINPIFDDKGNCICYSSVRRAPYPKEIEKAEFMYHKYA